MKKYHTFLMHVLFLVLTFSCNSRNSVKEYKTIQIINQSGLDDARAMTSFSKQCGRHDVKVKFSEPEEALTVRIKNAEKNESSHDLTAESYQIEAIGNDADLTFHLQST